MRLFLIFILFFLTEYLLRTFVESYKYHTVGFGLEFLPLMATALLSGLIYKNVIVNNRFGAVYLKLAGVSTASYIIVKVFLFVQWYWFIAPQYRNVPGDMAEGLGWNLLFLILGTCVILLSYLPIIFLIKSLNKKQKMF